MILMSLTSFRIHWITTALAGSLSLIAATAIAQIAPPKPGVPLPEAYVERMADDSNAFRFEKAWIGKANRAKKKRVKLLSRLSSRGLSSSMVPFDAPKETMVAGTIEVPVILVKYSNTGADPYPSSDLQNKLFDGPNPTGTVTDVYHEMSYGNVTMTGTVYPTSGDWVTAPQADTYYEGGQYGLDPCVSKTGELIMTALTTTDATVDFGIYDNDGPDGIPNSGDDDGFVDVVAIAHPEVGGECGTSNMWAHRWVVGGWQAFGASYVGNCQLNQIGNAYTTDDAMNGGGTIKIWDYVLVPAKGAGNGCGDQIAEIGVFCHELGHAFGLPDLYDTNGGGQGIGVHGLMGSGNWNQPTNPPHMSAWSKMELGWVTPVVVGSDPQTFSISNVNQNATIYQLNVAEKKFRRHDVTPVSGVWSLVCGLDADEGGARNWPGGAGYGNGWKETIERDFPYSGSGSVTLQYDVRYHTERDYDFGRVKIDVNNTVSELIAYHGIGMLSAQAIDLTPYLSGSGAASYTILFEFESDESVSDEDGQFDSGATGPFKLDNISVTGGGANHSADFEQSEDGWVYTTPPKEFFLVENRSKAAQFDQHLHSEGLYIWHIEENVVHSALGNTSGTSGTANLRPAGVTLMEADDQRDLLRGLDRGDAGDAYPGLSNNRAFTKSSRPDSRSHNLGATNVRVVSISNPGAVMSANLSGGEITNNPTPVYPLQLAQNQPNPFVPGHPESETRISFSLPFETSVSLNIFDVKGRLVTTLVNGIHPQGPNEYKWDGRNARGEWVASGVYFYQLRAAGQTASKKITFIRK